ncbi:hypothetical protein [Peribacillus sp. Bi96]|nr:hypothetical protein [Peribacillus sp. Bi96]
MATLRKGISSIGELRVRYFPKKLQQSGNPLLKKDIPITSKGD